MNRFIVVEHWFSGVFYGSYEQMEIRACVDTYKEARVYMCQHKKKNKHKWYIYEESERYGAF
mgnify:CR=1 FL=1